MQLLKSTAAFALTLLLSAFMASQCSAQKGAFPNEIVGFEFFGKGKLKVINLGISKKKDIEELFGSSCENSCDYDERFTIKVDYIGVEDCMITKKSLDRAVCPLDQYLGGIELISLIPKEEILIKNVPIGPFTLRAGGAFILKSPGSKQVSWESFGDGTGLKYSVRRENSRVSFPGPETIDGPMHSIAYGLSDQLIEQIFQAPFRQVKK